MEEKRIIHRKWRIWNSGKFATLWKWFPACVYKFESLWCSIWTMLVIHFAFNSEILSDISAKSYHLKHYLPFSFRHSTNCANFRNKKWKRWPYFHLIATEKFYATNVLSFWYVLEAIDCCNKTIFNSEP